MSEQWQAARCDAALIVSAALEADALPWSVNTPKNQRLDLLRGYITRLATQFMTEEKQKEEEYAQQSNSSAG